jgi:hypothetical protein
MSAQDEERRPLPGTASSDARGSEDSAPRYRRRGTVHLSDLSPEERTLADALLRAQASAERNRAHAGEP